MLDTPVRPGPDEPTTEFELVLTAPESCVDSDAASKDTGEAADPGRLIRTWVWMIVVSGFGLFLVFGSVRAHFWDENAAGTYYVPVTRIMQVLDIWRAQVNGLPEVAHQQVLKSVFIASVFAFIGLSVIALWLATVEIYQAPAAGNADGDSGGSDAASPSESASASIAPTG